MKLLISFILPGHNVANYVSDCINSILKQSIQNIEIIYVDDASTDNTAYIVRKMAIIDNRIKIVEHNQNKGSYAARNTGMQIAQGEWLIFLDPDDVLSPNFCKCLGATLNESEFNLIIFDYESFNDGSRLPEVTTVQNKSEILNVKDLLQRKDFAWTKLIKNSWIKERKISFYEGKTMWDILFHWQICIKAQKAIYIKENLVWYRQRLTASSYRKDWYRAEGFLVMDKVREFLSRNNLIEIYSNQLLLKELNLFYDICISFFGQKELVKKALVEVKKRITLSHWEIINKKEIFDKKKRDYFITFFRPACIPWSFAYLPSIIRCEIKLSIRFIRIYIKLIISYFFNEQRS